MSVSTQHMQTRTAGNESELWDPWLVISVTALLLIGLVMVYSSSVSSAAKVVGFEGYYLIRHGAHIIVGLVAMAIVMRTRSSLWIHSGPYLLLIGIGLLAALLVPGVGAHINGSTRWLRLGLVNLQPSEFMKLFIIIYVAGYLVRKQANLREFVPGIVAISAVLAIVGMLLLQQPDMGSLVVICATVIAMLYLGGVRFSHFLSVVFVGLGGMVLLTMISPYRLQRVTGFLNPWADPFDSGFQLVQSLIAFGRGELFGVGLGSSVQKLFYLPAAHTDFIFAVVGEELGFLGVLVVISLFAILVFRAFKIARVAESNGNIFAARLAQGIALLFGLQAMINMGVNMGVLPTKGLTLPLMSYGGSSMVVSCIGIGLLLMVDRENRIQSWGRY